MQKRTAMDIISVFFTVMTMFFGLFWMLDAEIADEEEFADRMIQEFVDNAESAAAMLERMTRAMDALQATSQLAFKQRRDQIIPQDETDKLYLQMAKTLDGVLELMRYHSNAYYFLNSQGLDKIIAANLGIRHTQLRSRLLLLTKVLFNVAPSNTKTLMPITVLDRLLDIFEDDDDLGMKTYAIDILSVWLPGSPRAQERVMKVKGLDPFYKHISKLDKSVINIILQLFTTLVKEHIAIRNMKPQKGKVDYALKTYRQIGLIERLSTPAVCMGLLDIIEHISSFNTKKQDDLNPVIELLRIVKPHCFRVYKARPKAINLIDMMLNFAQDADNKEQLEKMKLNATELVEFFTDFAEKVKPEPRDEL